MMTYIRIASDLCDLITKTYSMIVESYITIASYMIVACIDDFMLHQTIKQ